MVSAFVILNMVAPTSILFLSVFLLIPSIVMLLHKKVNILLPLELLKVTSMSPNKMVTGLSMLKPYVMVCYPLKYVQSMMALSPSFTEANAEDKAVYKLVLENASAKI